MVKGFSRKEQTESITMTVLDLQKLHGSLEALSQRSLSIKASVKVGRILSVVAPLVEPYVAAKRKKSVELFKEVDSTNNFAVARATLTVAEEHAQVDDDEIEVALPTKLILKEEDMPKKLDGEKGEDNTKGIAAIIAGLGPFYEWPES